MKLIAHTYSITLRGLQVWTTGVGSEEVIVSAAHTLCITVSHLC